MVNHTVVANQAAVELIEENGEKADKEACMGEGSSTGDLAPKQAPAS